MLMKSVLTCPHYRYKEEAEVPSKKCLTFYVCKNCNKMLFPKPEDCCVLCCNGTVKCPPK